ncbi:MAG: hypothetical protein KJ697_04235 [Nanoarchaeota archaeon]|nr:hypothetical protein [Nanoarchaeota archaeon]
MKGQMFTLTRTTIIVVVILVFSIAALFYASQWDIVSMLSGSCGNDMCESGETELSCPNDCSGEIIGIAEHIMIVTDDALTFTLSELQEDYLKYPIGGKEDCTPCTSCIGCYDSQDYSNAETCTLCDSCDSISGTCGFCDSCESAKSDHFEDTNIYSSCEACLECKNCEIKSGSLMSNQCDSCSYCLGCEAPVTPTIDYISSCDYCSFYQYTTQTSNAAYTGCSMCYGTDSISASKYFNICESCNSCGGGYGGKGCQDTEPLLCQRIKDCIAAYQPDNPQPCVIDYHLSASGASAGSITSVNSAIQNALIRCKGTSTEPDPIYGAISDSGKQFICNYDTAKATLREMDRNSWSENIIDNEWHGERESTYTQCGGTGYRLNRLYYNSWAFGDDVYNPIGVNYKIVLGDINPGTYATRFSDFGLEIPADNNCRFNMFVCAQPALLSTTSETEVDDYFSNPLTKIYSSVISMDEDDFKYFKEAPYEAIKSKEIEIDIGDDTADVHHIADATIAAVRDWIILSENDANTINKINTIITKDGNIDTFGDTIMQKLKINSKFSGTSYRTLDWQLVQVDSSLRDNTYDFGDKLFYAYKYVTTQTSTSSNTHEYSIPLNPIALSTLADSVKSYPIQVYLEWTDVSWCSANSIIWKDEDDSGTTESTSDNWKQIVETKENQRSVIINHDDKFNYMKLTGDLRVDDLYGVGKIKIVSIDPSGETGINCNLKTSKAYFKYSIAPKGDMKYVFYETDDLNNVNPIYTGKIKVQVAFYLESEKLRLEDESYIIPTDYLDNILVLTPIISIAQVN